ncbi:Tethering factor for nuclear proteasome sts1 [Phlyctochytrium bullatum]|nr:Tethering factor for nuclear proteasome sts1 [Phlyctochytrium bullatum]
MATVQALPPPPSDLSPSRGLYGRKRKVTDEDVTMGQTTDPSDQQLPFNRWATPSKRIKTFNLDTSSPPPSAAIITSSADPSSPFHNQIASLPLVRLLETMSKEELTSMILSLVAQHPTLESSVANLLPRPTLASASAHLQQLLNKLQAAFPYSRWGPDRSDYAFNRTRSHLSDCLEAFQHYLLYFTNPAMYTDALAHEYPSHAFSFLRYGATFAAALPVWSSEHHNALCRDLAYQKLAKGWRVAVNEIARRIRDENRMFPASLLAEWARDLTAESTNLKGAFGFGAALQEFTQKLGWAIGLSYP